MRKMNTLFVALIATTALWAADFYVDGIAYKKLGGDSVEVTSKSLKYSDSINIPAFVTYGSTAYRVTSIGESTFFACDSLTFITIPNSVTRIGDAAFDGCSTLSFISIPNSVTHMGYSVFSWCTSLSAITIPSSVTYIGERAFAWCTSLSTINVDATNKHFVSIDGVLFNYVKDSLIQYPAGNTRTKYSIPNSVTSIGSFAFFACDSLISITIPNSVTNIGGRAFEHCKSLSSVTIPNNVTSIGEYAFYGCTSLTSTTIPNSVIRIGDAAFSYCSSLCSIIVDAANIHYVSLDGVLFNYAKDTIIQYPIGNKRSTYTIPNSVTYIGERAFYGCKFITSITIPNSVTNIGFEAFSVCTSLSSITSYATTPPVCFYWCFDNVDKSIPLYVPEGSIDAYKAADEWKDFTNIQAIAAEEVTEPVTTVVTIPNDNSVTITWPTTTGADTYTIDIQKGNDIFCILTFNAQGQLTSIAFAPGRGANNEVAATAVAGGYKFTITSLNPGTQYTYEVDTKNAEGTSIANYTGEFTTTGSTGIVNVNENANVNVNRKIIRDGQLYILRDGKMYNAQGGEL